MRVAYITSRFPDVSHTFILREIQALRSRGLEIRTFSIRRPQAQNVHGADARAAAAQTKWLVPPPVVGLVVAILWVLFTRPVPGIRAGIVALTVPGVEIKRRIKWCLYFLESVLLAYWLHRDRIEHIHAHFGNNGASTAMLAAEILGLPFSFTCHGSEIVHARANSLAEKVARANFVVCVSEYGRQLLLDHCDAHFDSKLVVLRCGPPPVQFAPKPKMSSPLAILCVARLSPEKGHADLLDALRLLRESGVSFECRLVGDGPLQMRLAEELDAKKLSDCVTMLGALAQEEVLERYVDADVIVLSSHSEGVPVVLMEAMAVGRPIVATDVGGVSELVIDGRTGLLVPPRDPARLAQALQKLAADPVLAERLVNHAHSSVHERFDLNTTSDRLVELFRNEASEESGAGQCVLTCTGA